MTLKLISFSCLMLFLLNTSSIFSQKHYRTGYVVLFSGDTLHGKIKDRTPEPFGDLLDKIRFKGKKGGTKKYGPKDIKSYKMGDDLFESHWIADRPLINSKFFRKLASQNGGETIFLKVIRKGPLNYYKQEYKDPDSGYYDFCPYYRKQNETNFFFIPLGILGKGRKATANYLKDCPSVSEKVMRGELKGFITILEAYEKECAK